MPTPSDKHSDCYFHLKARIVEMKNGATTIITAAPINLTPEQAVEMFRKSLHEFVNAEYSHDHGLTEDEAELLHAIINNERDPRDD